MKQRCTRDGTEAKALKYGSVGDIRMRGKICHSKRALRRCLTLIHQ